MNIHISHMADTWRTQIYYLSVIINILDLLENYNFYVSKYSEEYSVLKYKIKYVCCHSKK